MRAQPLPAQHVREVDQQDRVLADQPHQHDHADQREDVERVAGQVQAQERADQRDRQAEHDRQRRQQRLVQRHHQHVDQHDRERERLEQRRERRLLLLDLTGVGDLVPLRQRHAGHRRPDVAGHVAERAAGHVRRDLDHALAVGALDPGRAAVRHDRRHLPEPDQRAALAEQRDRGDRVGGALGCRRDHPHVDLVADLGVHLGHHRAADHRPHGRCHRRRAQVEVVQPLRSTTARSSGVWSWALFWTSARPASPGRPSGPAGQAAGAGQVVAGQADGQAAAAALRQRVGDARADLRLGHLPRQRPRRRQHLLDGARPLATCPRAARRSGRCGCWWSRRRTRRRSRPS